MPKLLHIESSPRKQRSKSITIARRFVKRWEAQNPTATVETLDLWKTELPEFDGFTIDSKYKVLHGQEHTQEEAVAWAKVVSVCDHFKSADSYLLSLPMWNFGIPYKLKHYIDVIAQPGQTFSFSPDEGYAGLVTGKPICVVYARGGSYGTEASQGMDLQRSYVQLLLGFIGFTDIHEVIIEPTLAGPDDIAKTEQLAIEAAEKIAESF